MRTPKYLSASAIFLFYSDREEYYLKYLATTRPPKLLQTHAMSCGSGFDARVKSYLYEKIFGEVPPEFEVRKLFESQVEKHNWEWCWPHSEHIFNQYKKSGALRDLLILLRKATNIKMETRCQGELFGVPFLGFPDLQFIYNGRQMIIDWKVNGYCGKNGASPKAGYIKCTDGWEGKQSRNNGSAHKDAALFEVDGILINTGKSFEDVDKKWAFQTLVYCWLNGVPFEENPIIGIEQLSCKPSKTDDTINVRVAQHRGRVSAAFRQRAKDQIIEVWDTITRGHIINDDGITTTYPHIFKNMTKADSDARCETLEGHYAAFDGSDPLDKWFSNTSRQSKMW